MVIVMVLFKDKKKPKIWLILVVLLKILKKKWNKKLTMDVVKVKQNIKFST